MSSETQQPSDMTAMEMTQQIIDAHVEHRGYDELTFENDTITLTTTEELITEHTPLTVTDIESVEQVTITEDENGTTCEITFELWLALRRAKREEFEACKQGIEAGLEDDYESADMDEFSSLEEEFFEVGFEYGIEADDGKDDPEIVLNGRVPQVILYHRDGGYSGPKYFGTAINYNQLTDFDPDNAGDMITDADSWGMETHDSPDVELETQDGDAYRLVYWIDE